MRVLTTHVHPSSVTPRPLFPTLSTRSDRHHLQRWALWLLVSATLLWALAVGAVWLWQERLLFKPQPLAQDHRFNLALTQEVHIEVPGAQLHALHLRQPHAKGVVFFLHGNDDNLAVWFTSADF